VPVYAIDGRATRWGVAYGADLASGHDAPLQKRFYVLAGHVKPYQHDLFFEFHVGKRAVDRFRG